jgi:hypothetical protein
MISMKDYTQTNVANVDLTQIEVEQSLMDEFVTFEKLIDKTTLRNDSILYRWDSLF